MPFTHPMTVELSQRVPAITGTNDAVRVIGRAPFAGVVSAVTYTGDASLTGHAANNRVLSIINKGAAGAGTNVPATMTTTLSPDNGLTAFDEKSITLSGTASHLVVAEGDILVWSTDAQSSGVNDPGGVVRVVIERS